MKPFLAAGLTTALLGLAPMAQALTVASETATPGGDYADTIDTGPNITVPGALPDDDDVDLTGRLRLNCVSSDCSDTSGLRDPSDAFFFTVGPDQEVIDVLFSFDESDVTTGSLSSVVFELSISGPGVIVDESYIGPVTNDALNPGSPFGPGTYSVFFGAVESAADFTGRVNWQFSSFVENTAAPVPLPASAPVLLAGLGALTLMRRKRG